MTKARRQQPAKRRGLVPTSRGAAAHHGPRPQTKTATPEENLLCDLLRRLDAAAPRAALALPDGSAHLPGLKTAEPRPSPSVYGRLNTAIGCKTDELAVAVIVQVMKLEHPTKGTSAEAMEKLNVRATALLAELEPKTATELLLAAQMVGSQRLAMEFMYRATFPDQAVEGVDSNVLRATRLMRLFNEQVEAMAKLKGTGGQQRVVVEHVTVAAGGQAIVGAVSAPRRGEGAGGV